MGHCPWTDEELKAWCQETRYWLNRVEADVLFALYEGHASSNELISQTGYTRGQVAMALAVLNGQGLVIRYAFPE